MFCMIIHWHGAGTSWAGRGAWRLLWPGKRLGSRHTGRTGASCASVGVHGAADATSTTPIAFVRNARAFLANSTSDRGVNAAEQSPNLRIGRHTVAFSWIAVVSSRLLQITHTHTHTHTHTVCPAPLHANVSVWLPHRPNIVRRGQSHLPQLGDNYNHRKHRQQVLVDLAHYAPTRLVIPFGAGVSCVRRPLLRCSLCRCDCRGLARRRHIGLMLLQRCAVTVSRELPFSARPGAVCTHEPVRRGTAHKNFLPQAIRWGTSADDA